jgi:hypothetical protein
MEPYEDRITTVNAMFKGFARAADRFYEAALGDDAEEASIPLFEALSWAAALDWRIGAHWTPDGKPLGGDWPARLGNADVVYAVRFARNSLHHQWFEALVVDDSRTMFPIRLPTAFREWLWQSASELPKPDRRRRDRRGKAIYERELQGRPARHTLEALTVVFEKLRDFLEPWNLCGPRPQPPTVTTEPLAVSMASGSEDGASAKIASAPGGP